MIRYAIQATLTLIKKQSFMQIPSATPQGACVSRLTLLGRQEDLSAWSIPKGILACGEDRLAAAK
jgi:hypothetical protein